MALYVSITLLAGLVALGSGVDKRTLFGVVWGTTVGLALAHWFAFTLAARGSSGGAWLKADVEAAIAEVAGAGAVALFATVPVLFLPAGAARVAALWVPVGIVGFAGYLTGRASGRSRARSFAVAGFVLVAAFAVVAIKLLIAPK